MLVLLLLEEVQAGISEFQDPLQRHKELKVNLGYMRPWYPPNTPPDHKYRQYKESTVKETLLSQGRQIG